MKYVLLESLGPLRLESMGLLWPQRMPPRLASLVITITGLADLASPFVIANGTGVCILWYFMLSFR